MCISPPCPQPRAVSEPAEFAAVADVARRLGVSRQTITRHIEAGGLPALDIGTRTRRFWRINAADLAAFTETRTARVSGADHE